MTARVVVKTTYTATGEGSRPTVGELKRVLEPCPDDAEVRLTVVDDQREGTYWTLICEARP